MPVAQLNRVSVSEAEGHGFDSRRAHFIKIDKDKTMRPLEFIFSVRNERFRKVFTIFGIQIKIAIGKSFNKYFPVFLPPYCAYFFLSLISFWGNKTDFDIENDYKNLIRNLDDQSIDTIDGILDFYRLRSSKDAKKLLSRIKEFKIFHKNFYKIFESKILKINDNLYSYDKYMLPIRHFESSVFYHKHSIKELTTLDKVRQKAIIDVGGFIGDSALVFSDFTDKKIYSFEPSVENFEFMKKTIELNNLTNVVPVNIALGDKVSEILSICGNSSCVSIAPPPSGTLSSNTAIEATTLDNFVAKNNIEVGLIKVDIEGYEQKFLKGAENTIKNQKPVLLISIYHSLDDFLHIKPIIESWNLGYTFRIIKPKESYFLETLLVAEVLN